jgi:hypothetical protein
MIRRTVEEALDESQNQLDTLFKKVDEKRPPLEIVNVETFRRMLAGSTFSYQGERYRVPRLPFEAGVELKKLELEVQRMNRYVASGMMMEEYRLIARRLAAIMWTVVWPTSRWAIVRKRLGMMRNPFRQATDFELGQVLSFCLAHRMTSTIEGGFGGPLPSVESQTNRPIPGM